MKYRISTFFAIGLLIYLIDIGLNSSNNTKDIYISDEEITSLISAWESQVGRKPTSDEVTRIINNLIEEEVLYREALDLGLDREDRIIKRRLAQKITFLKQESLPERPSNDELFEFYEANKENYYVQPTYSFTHLYFSDENNPEVRAESAYKKILNNLDVESDLFFWGKNFTNTDINEIERNFGNNFSINFDNISLDKWHGPFESSFGYHIIMVKDYKPGFYIELVDSLDQVEIDLISRSKEAAVDEFISKVKSEYTVIINPNLKF